jgi:exopolysaccharide biosynthesis WecB/TagA/CpsF family protein
MVEKIDATVSQRQVCLGYVNTHTAYLLARDPAYRSLFRDFMLLNDGIGLDLLSLIRYGRAFEFNLNGSDFTPLLLQATKHRHRIFVLGGRPGVADRAAAALQKIAPQHEYVGAHRGHLQPHEEDGVVRAINAARATLVIVGFGNPDQEVWMAKHAPRLDAGLLIGVGALLDFLAGSVPRAPAWMQRARIEWLHRVALEPRRLWKRYFLFTPALVLRAATERVRRLAAALVTATMPELWADHLAPLAAML